MRAMMAAWTLPMVSDFDVLHTFCELTSGQHINDVIEFLPPDIAEFPDEDRCDACGVMPPGYIGMIQSSRCNDDHMADERLMMWCAMCMLSFRVNVDVDV